MTGMWVLTRLILRLDRIRLAIWVATVALLVVAVASSWDSLYPTMDQRQAIAATISATPALAALLGPLFDVSTGGLTAWRMGTGVTLVLAIMNLLTVTRHTRADEQNDRAEFVFAGCVGRRAPLGAALLVTGLADLACAAATTAGLLALGLPAGGAIAFALAVAVAAWSFAAVSGITCQVLTTARGANAAAGLVLGAAFVAAMAINLWRGDATLATPFGWVQQARAFSGNRMEPILLGLVTAGLLAGVGLWLAGRRDYAAGLFAPRLGRLTAALWLSGPIGLSWRLGRQSLAVWVAAFLVLGAMLGSMQQAIRDFASESPQMAQMIARFGLGADIVRGYFAMVLSMAALAASFFAIGMILHLRSEETEGLADLILAGAVPRVRWAASQIGLALVGVAAMLAVLAALLGLVGGTSTSDDTGGVGNMIAAAGAQVPAVLVMIGLAVALVGLVPRFSGLAWAALAACFALALLGRILRLPDWIVDLSPFNHSPAAPAAAITAMPLVVMAVIAAALTALGLVGLRRRDIG